MSDNAIGSTPQQTPVQTGNAAPPIRSETPTAPAPLVTTSEAPSDDKLDQLMNEALSTIHDMEPPAANMTPDELVAYLDGMAAKLATVGGKLAREVLKNARASIKIETQQRTDKILENAAQLEKAEKRQKIISGIMKFLAILSPIATVLTAGTATGPLAGVATGLAVASAATAITQTIVESTHAFDKMSPKAQKAFKMVMMIAQLALALASIATAVRGAVAAGKEVTTAALEKGLKGAIEGAKQGAEKAAADLAKEAAKEITAKVLQTTGKEAAEEAAKKIAAEVAEGASDEVVAATAKAALKKAADEAVDGVMAAVNKGVTQGVSKELAAEIAKDVMQQMGDDLMAQMVQEAGSEAAKAAITRVSDDVVEQVGAKVVEHAVDKAAAQGICRAVAKSLRQTEAAGNAVAGGEAISLAVTHHKIGLTRHDIEMLEAQIQQNQRMTELMVEWSKEIGENYMQAQETIRTFASDMNSAEMTAITSMSGLSGPGANAS